MRTRKQWEIDYYREQLIELERVVCESALLGPVTILGDLMHTLEGRVGVEVWKIQTYRSTTARDDGENWS